MEANKAILFERLKNFNSFVKSKKYTANVTKYKNGSNIFNECICVNINILQSWL